MSADASYAGASSPRHPSNLRLDAAGTPRELGVDPTPTNDSVRDAEDVDADEVHLGSIVTSPKHLPLHPQLVLPFCQPDDVALTSGIDANMRAKLARTSSRPRTTSPGRAGASSS
jgi:hypothetical protein